MSEKRLIALTPELNRLNIRTNQNYVVPGRTRQATRRANQVAIEEKPVLEAPSRIRPVPVRTLFENLELGGLMAEGPAVNSRNSLDNLSENDLDRTLYELGPVHQQNEVGLDQRELLDLGVELNVEEAPAPAVEQAERRQHIINRPAVIQGRANMEGFNYKTMYSVVPEFNGEFKNLDRFIRAVDLFHGMLDMADPALFINIVLVKLTDRAQVLAREGAAYNTWEDLKHELKHRFKVPRPEKAVRKALEKLCQGSDQSVRSFATNVEDTLAEFIAVISPDVARDRRFALIEDRESQALEVFVDGLYGKLRDWAKARDFGTLREAVEFALNEEHNIKPRNQSELVVKETAKPKVDNAKKTVDSRSNSNYKATMRCYICKKLGHGQYECAQNENKSVKCEFCHKQGHREENCFSKRYAHGNQASATGSSFKPKNSEESKNRPGPSGQQANIRTVKAQVQHQEDWNEIVRAPEPNQS